MCQGTMLSVRNTRIYEIKVWPQSSLYASEGRKTYPQVISVQCPQAQVVMKFK